MKVRIKIQPSGLYNGQPWPAVGKTIELPDHVAVGMLNSKLVEPIKAGAKQETATPKDTSEKAAPKPSRRNARQVAAPAAADDAGDDDKAVAETGDDSTAGDTGTPAEPAKD